MKIARTIAIVSAALAALCLAAPSGAATLSLVGSSTKVCQLTGQTDWDTGLPTDAQTQTNYGLQGIDLGFPVESDTGELYLMFGDAVPPNHPPASPASVPPDDGFGKTNRTTAPDSKTCIDMKMFGGQGVLLHPVVTPPIQQGSFNVPTGGIYVEGKFWGFFWTNHCTIPVGQLPIDKVTPLKTPAPFTSPWCAEIPLNNSIGTSVIAYSTDANPLAFTRPSVPAAVALPPVSMPNGFVYVTAGPPLPRIRGVDYVRGYVPPIPVFGVPRYRASIPYLALAPQATFGNPTTWKFYAGGGSWVTYAQWQSGSVGGMWSPPPGAELYADSPNPFSGTGDERCVGEHQVTYEGALQTWLMLYTCGGLQVEARTAPSPEGPWSAPTVILSAVTNPGLFCTLFWRPPVSPGVPGKCPGKVNGQPLPALTFGYLYAPFVLARYTQTLTKPGGPRTAHLYWLLSTWDPYEVVVMQSTLEMN
jgi:hypothetical protein